MERRYTSEQSVKLQRWRFVVQFSALTKLVTPKAAPMFRKSRKAVGPIHVPLQYVY